LGRYMVIGMPARPHGMTELAIERLTIFDEGEGRVLVGLDIVADHMLPVILKCSLIGLY